MKRAATQLTIAAALTTAAAAAHANPLNAFGFGARAKALGGAATTEATDFSAAYYNPSLLAEGEAIRFDLGYTYNAPTLRLNRGDLGVDPSRGFEGGLVLAGRLFDHKVGFGLGLFLPDARLSRIRALPQQQPRFALYDNDPQRVVITTALAFEVLEGLYVGAALSFLSNTSGTLDIAGKVNATSADLTAVFSAVDVDLTAVRYPAFGVMWTPWPEWRFGVTFRDEFDLHLDLDVRVHGDITLGAEELVLVKNGTFLLSSMNDNLFSPRQLSFGVSHRGDGWTLALDVTWNQWSRYPAPTSTIRLMLDLGDLEFMVPLPDDPLPPGFHDTVVPRIGAEVMLHDGPDLGVALRVGYAYEPTPVPGQPGRTNYVDSDKHDLSVGLGLRVRALEVVLPRPITLDLAGQALFLTRRTYEKDDPADPIGDYTADGYLLGLSATLGIAF